MAQANPIPSDPTPKEASRRINCSVPTVYKLLREGLLRGYKVGAGTRITHESLEELRNSDAFASKKAAA